MPRKKPDLILSSDIPEPRQIFLDVSQVRPGRLTLLEALDMAEASDVDPDNFVVILQTGTQRQKAKLLYAFAWILARRSEPEISYDEILKCNLIVQGKMPTDADRDRDEKRAKAIAAVSKVAGIPPSEAENLTMAEVKAFTDLVPKRPIRQGARRRRVG